MTIILPGQYNAPKSLIVPAHYAKKRRPRRTPMAIPHQFRNPRAQLHPYLRECVRSLDKFGFCVVSGELIVEKNLATHVQLEMFREAMRNVSNEKGQNLLIDEHLLAKSGDNAVFGRCGDLLIALLPQNMEGTMPDDRHVPTDGDPGGELTKVKIDPAKIVPL